MIRVILFLPFALLSLCRLTEAQLPQFPILSSEHDISFDASFDQWVEELLQVYHVPGLSLAIVDNGKIISKGYGFANLSPLTNATANTQYFTGSTTKAFTAAAVAHLIHDEDKYPDLKWSSPINNFLRSDFVLEDEYSTNHLTIEDALSHRTGMPRHDFIYGQKGDTPSTIVQRMRYLPTTAQPRALWQYCNLMFVVMTDLVETLTGRKLEAVLEETFWKPLGMSSTTFTLPSSTAQKDSRLARGYYWDGDYALPVSKGEYVADAYVDLAPISGAGATISTVNDYALWMRAWLAAAHKNTENQSSPITHRMFRDLLAPRSIIDIPLPVDDLTNSSAFIIPPGYALAWFNSQILGQPVVSHGGSLTGFGTEMFLLPDRGFGIVAMGNTEGTSNEVGALVCLSLMLRKVLPGMVSIESSVESLLRAFPRPHVRRPMEGFRGKVASASRSGGLAHGPVSLDKYAGTYSHPAYGSLNLTLTTSSQTSEEKMLEAVIYPRTWRAKMQLSHLTDNSFMAKYFMAHGTGDVVTGEGIVWEEAGEADAVFELGLEANGVQRLGVVLESGMVEAVEREGDLERDWRECMIWFEKA